MTTFKDTIGQVVKDALARHSVAENSGAGVVPPSGLEPELPEEPHFECGASTNSAKGAVDDWYFGIDWASSGPEDNTMPHYTQKRVYEHSYPTPNGRYQNMWNRLVAMLLRIALPGDLEVQFYYDSRDYWYLQVGCSEGACNVSGEPLAWRGRKWLLSEHMADGEIVQTVFKACLTAQEHELREQFRYCGESIYDPHYDPDMLCFFRELPGVIEERA